MNTVERKLRQGLSVADLIAEMKQYPQDAQVVFACDYGDHCHTQQALPVESVEALQDDERLDESGYSQSGLAIEKVDAEDEDAEDNEVLVTAEGNRPAVVVLR